MADNGNGFNPEQGRVKAPEVDIPDLKKREKEKKAGGIVIPGAPAGGGGIISGGAVQAAGGGGLKALFAGKLGAAAIALGLGGTGLVGYGVWHQSHQQARGGGPVNLSPIGSSMKVRKRTSHGSKSLAYMAKAANGELNWDDPKTRQAAGRDKTAEAGKGAEGPETPEMPDAAKMAEEAAANAGAGKEDFGRLKSKLSSALGGSGAFGKKNIFSGGTGFKSPGISKLGSGFKKTPFKRGTTRAMKRAKSSLSAKRISTRGAMANRAMGQLKFANRKSASASDASETGASRTYAADAFDQASTEGGAGAGGMGGGLSGGEESGLLGSGANDITSGGGGSTTGAWEGQCTGGYVPDTEGNCVAASNVTPYQTQMDSGQDMIMIGIMLAVIGIALIVIALTMEWTLVAGIILAIGIILLAMGVMMAMSGGDTAGGGANQYGQSDQADVAEEHGAAGGTGVASEETIDMDTHETDVDEAVQSERGATYQ